MYTVERIHIDKTYNSLMHATRRDKKWPSFTPLQINHHQTFFYIFIGRCASTTNPHARIHTQSFPTLPYHSGRMWTPRPHFNRSHSLFCCIFLSILSLGSDTSFSLSKTVSLSLSLLFTPPPWWSSLLLLVASSLRRRQLELLLRLVQLGEVVQFLQWRFPVL